MIQGRAMAEYEVRRISCLLAKTDMSLGEIAERMKCSRSAVGSINRQHQIRNYAGKRSVWIHGAKDSSDEDKHNRSTVSRAHA